MAAISKSNNKGSGSSSSGSERLKTSDKPTPLLPLIMDAKRWQKITQTPPTTNTYIHAHGALCVSVHVVHMHLA